MKLLEVRERGGRRAEEQRSTASQCKRVGRWRLARVSHGVRAGLGRRAGGTEVRRESASRERETNKAVGGR
eukprot:2954261-Rhodomonas_salina.2